mgnify:CR=1 FL=1
MKLSERKGEAAFDAFVELSGPIFEISGDPELYELVSGGGVSMLEWLNAAMKSHRSALIKVLAVLNDEDEEGYAARVTFSDILNGVNELFADKLLVSLFLPQGQKKSKGRKTSSGSATGNIEEKEK